MLVLDVRESAEYAFSHIPGAKSLPLGDLESELGILIKKRKFTSYAEQEIAVM